MALVCGADAPESAVVVDGSVAGSVPAPTLTPE